MENSRISLTRREAQALVEALEVTDITVGMTAEEAAIAKKIRDALATGTHART